VKVFEQAFSNRELFPLLIGNYLFPGKVQRLKNLLDQLRIILRKDTHRIAHLVLQAGTGKRELVMPRFLF
jgi:hypothetical protein